MDLTALFSPTRILTGTEDDILRSYHGANCPCCSKGIEKGIQLKVNWAPSEFGTIEQLANQLTNGFNDGIFVYWNMSDSDASPLFYPKGDTLTFNVAGTTNQYTVDGVLHEADEDGISDEDYLDQIREAFKLVGLTTGIKFKESN